MSLFCLVVPPSHSFIWLKNALRLILPPPPSLPPSPHSSVSGSYTRLPAWMDSDKVARGQEVSRRGVALCRRAADATRRDGAAPGTDSAPASGRLRPLLDSATGSNLDATVRVCVRACACARVFARALVCLRARRCLSATCPSVASASSMPGERYRISRPAQLTLNTRFASILHARAHAHTRMRTHNIAVSSAASARQRLQR